MLDKILPWVDAYLLRLLAWIFGLRVLFLFVNGLDLIGDESYYWDWSRHPDWCYYSKPPMVAWLIGLFTWALGDYTAVVRLPAVLLGTVGLFYFHATCKAFYGARAAAFAFVLLLATPINVIANLLMTIDPPLYCFWIMTLYYLRQALFERSDKAWWLAGFASAAALLSKQAALALPVMLLLFLLANAAYRHYLRREFWWYLAPILIAVVPILMWNLNHDWVMFGHSKGHFANHEPAALTKHFKWAADFLLYQLLLLSPLTFALVLSTSLICAYRFKSLNAEQRFLWLMGPALLLAVLLLSLLQKVQGNWPMPFYFSALMLLAGRYADSIWQKASHAAVYVGAVLVLLTYALPVLLSLLPIKDSVWDPTTRFKNWQAIAAAIQMERQKTQTDLKDTFVVALGHRYLASQLAFYLPDHPKVYRYEASGQIVSQYEVWPGPEEFAGKNAFIVGNGNLKLPAPLYSAFERVDLVGQLPNPNRKESEYFIYFGQRLGSWPYPALQKRISSKD